jgi:hypothetical protein
MLLAENLVCKSNLQQSNTCDQGFTECEWIYQNNDELRVEEELEQLVDLEKQILKE